MTSRRYQVAFFALGWLLLIGFAMQRGLNGFAGRAMDAVSGRMASLGQSLSDREAEARGRVQTHARRDDVARAYPALGA
ncbi:MAG TPA: hypothetical protein VNN08_14120, partial [Thermoanaerobaculia bacterium]|nr:hypothetical protein [Thermoanaerobaculia bacterium]